MRRATRHAAAAGIVCAVGIGTFVSTPAHAALIIDTFSDKNAGVWPIVKTTSYSGGEGVIEGSSPDPSLSGAIGGARGTSINDVNLAVPGLDNVTANVFNTGGFSLFDYASTAGAKGGFALDYGRPAGFSNLYDVDASSYNTLQIVIADYDAPTGQTLKIDSSLFTGDLGLLLPTVNVTTAGPQTINVPISPAIASQLAHNNGAEIRFDVPKGGDIRIESVSLVPEPGAAGLLLVAVPWVLRRRGR